MSSDKDLGKRGRTATSINKARGRRAYMTQKEDSTQNAVECDLKYYNTPDMVFIGKRLKEERNRLHYTQDEVSEMIGVTPAYVGHIERGERGFSIETLIKLCNVYKVTIDYLFEDVIQQDKNSISEQISLLLRDKDENQQKAILDIMKAVIRNI
ncbi:MAG: helix-turn-helix transcriptional regulator [Clostridia bacterium]|nr:helix-turn-helix transcriptional regulator [Clostridia bacterium]